MLMVPLFGPADMLEAASTFATEIWLEQLLCNANRISNDLDRLTGLLNNDDHGSVCIDVSLCNQLQGS